MLYTKEYRQTCFRKILAIVAELYHFMSLPETTDLTLAKNWTPKTLATAVINTLSHTKARDIWALLTSENVELNDFLNAHGKLKKVDFTSLIHYIFQSGLIRTRTGHELISMVAWLYMRACLQERKRMEKVIPEKDEKEEALVMATEKEKPQEPTFREVTFIQHVSGPNLRRIHTEFSRATRTILNAIREAA